MRILEDLGTKLFWLFVTVLLLGCGYVFLVRNFLNPPKIASIPNVTTTTPIPPSQSTTTQSSDPNNWSPQLKDNNGTVSQTSKSHSPKIQEISQPKARIIEVPKKLKKGALVYVYKNEIEETNPETHLYQPKEIIELNNFNLVANLKNEFQEVRGFFYVPKTSTYAFKLSKKQLNISQHELGDKILFLLSIDGITLPNLDGEKVNLEAGWHSINLYFNPPNKDYIDPAFVSLLWGEHNSTHITNLQPIITWRGLNESK